MDCLSSTSADVPIGIGLLPTSHPSYEAVVRAVTAEVVFQVYEKLEARFVAKSGAILQPILIDQDEIGCDHSDELLHGYANDLAVAYAAHVSIGSVFGVDESAGVRDVVDTLKDASQSVGVVLKHGRYLGDKLDLVASLSASSVEGEFQLARDRYDSFSYSCGLSPREVEWIDTDYFVRKGLTNNDLIGLMYPYHPMMIREERGTIPDTGLHFDKRDGKLFVRYPHGVWPDEQFDLNDWYRWVTERLYKVGRQEEPVRTESAKELADYVVVMNFLLGAVVRDFMLKFENLLRDQHCRITKEYLPVEFDDYGALDGDVRSALAVALEGLVLEKMRLERGKGGTCSIAGLHVGLVPFASGWLAAGKVMSVAMRAERMVITPRGTFFRSGT